MRRFVRSEGWLGAAVGVVASLIAWLVHAASVGEAYVIICVLAIAGLLVLFWPERNQLWREMRGPRRLKR
jgi:hypothetical protein